jgi:hypothetical protein
MGNRVTTDSTTEQKLSGRLFINMGVSGIHNGMGSLVKSSRQARTSTKFYDFSTVPTPKF